MLRIKLTWPSWPSHHAVSLLVSPPSCLYYVDLCVFFPWPCRLFYSLFYSIFSILYTSPSLFSSPLLFSIILLSSLLSFSLSLSPRYFTCLHWSLTQFTPTSMEVYPTNAPWRTWRGEVFLFWVSNALNEWSMNWSMTVNPCFFMVFQGSMVDSEWL